MDNEKEIINEETGHKKNEGEKRFSCPRCPKSYNRRHKLQWHVEGNHSDQEFKCDKCQKSFVNSRGLQAHKKVQHEEGGGGQPVFKRFFCTVCNKGFHGKDQLTNHMRSHTGKGLYLT